MAINHNANFDVLARQESGPMANMVRMRNCGFEGFVKKDGIPDDCGADEKTFTPSAFDDLVQFYDFVSKSDTPTFEANVAKTLQLSDYIGWYIHGTTIMSSDSYAKNGLHYHDPMGGPWRAIVWDYNASFGQDWATRRATPNMNPASFATVAAGTPATNNLWKRLLNSPTYGPMIKARYAAVLKNELKIDTVLAQWDAMVKEVDAGAKRDERKWGTAYKNYYGPTTSYKRSDFLTYTQEIAYTRQWLQDRWKFLQTLYP
jgi:hypothetical protein